MAGSQRECRLRSRWLNVPSVPRTWPPRRHCLLYGSGFAGPKLVCVDIQPYTTSQAPERSDILNVGGFSDAVFKVVAAFLRGDEDRFVAEVEAVQL